jgi:nucleoside-diphosphate-sugar epimerase
VSRRILVLGGTRFIGPHLVRALADAGHRVAVFHRGTTVARLPAGVEHLHGDVGDLAPHAEAFARFAPEAVIHMYAMTPRHAEEAVRAFRGRTGRLVVLSSADVYRARNRLLGVEPGPPDPVPLAEDAPLRSVHYPYRADRRPDDPLYDYDKVLVERIAMEAGDLPATVLRLPFVYGPGDHQHRLFDYLRRMDAGRPALAIDAGLAGWRCTRGYAGNVAAAIALAAVHPRAAGRIYNVGEAETFTEAEWVRRVGDAAGWAGEVVPVPAGTLPGHRPGVDWTQHLVQDTGRIRDELGYAPEVPLETWTERTVAWERAHPPDAAPPFDAAAEDAALARAGWTPGGAEAIVP